MHVVLRSHPGEPARLHCTQLGRGLGFRSGPPSEDQIDGRRTAAGQLSQVPVGAPDELLAEVQVQQSAIADHDLRVPPLPTGVERQLEPDRFSGVTGSRLGDPGTQIPHLELPLLRVEWYGRLFQDQYLGHDDAPGRQLETDDRTEGVSDDHVEPVGRARLE